jgi:hypothetical protein
MLQLTWPSVAALLRGHAAEHQSLGGCRWQDVAVRPERCLSISLASTAGNVEQLARKARRTVLAAVRPL